MCRSARHINATTVSMSHTDSVGRFPLSLFILVQASTATGTHLVHSTCLQVNGTAEHVPGKKYASVCQFICTVLVLIFFHPACWRKQGSIICAPVACAFEHRTRHRRPRAPWPSRSNAVLSADARGTIQLNCPQLMLELLALWM